MGSIDKVANGWRARWRTPEGASRSKMFARKTDAAAHVSAMEADKLRGSYVDRNAGKVLFKDYAERWLSAQTYDESTRENDERRLRLHAFPVLGRRHLSQIRPSTIQAWLRTLDHLGPNYRVGVFTVVSAVLNAAVDDELIVRNPCRASSVRRPRLVRTKVEPWSVDDVQRVMEALPERYRIVAVLGAGLGLRQGEIFGLSPDDVDFLRGTVEVRRQVKRYGNSVQAFALPKGGKVRSVPLAGVVRDALAAHLAAFPAQAVTLPWGSTAGEPVTFELVVTTRFGGSPTRQNWNREVWKPALAKAGLADVRENGCHALRHHFASVLLHGGESVKALSEYLGHSNPGFTLRTYTHLMPESHERSRRALDAAWSCVTAVSRAAE